MSSQTPQIQPIIDIREECKDRSELKILEMMAESALLDPCEETRQGAIAALNKKYDSMITGGFVGDNQLFLVNANGRIYYICDAPVMYVYCPPQKFPFNLKNPAG